MIRSPEGEVSPQEVLELAGVEVPEPSEELERMKALTENQLSVMRGQTSAEN
jgi:hypothetical protein